jgi:hypothetical protein
VYCQRGEMESRLKECQGELWPTHADPDHACQSIEFLTVVDGLAGLEGHGLCAPRAPVGSLADSDFEVRVAGMLQAAGYTDEFDGKDPAEWG